MSYQKLIWQQLWQQSNQAMQMGEVPVAAAVVKNQQIIAIAHNEVEAQKNPAAHAEMLALQRASTLLENKFLSDADLYVTLEPCAMCAGAIAHFRIRKLYFGAYDAKAGAVESGIGLFQQPTCHHAPEIYGGINELEYSKLLKQFFLSKR
jgi:tRNA(adenine34) deaminase